MQSVNAMQNELTRVGVRHHSRSVAGRIPSFTDAEIEVLRRAARRVKAERDWSGAELGRAIGIAQQNAGRFIAAGSTAGMDRSTANKLAKIAGYRDVEHLLLEAGVLAEMDAPPTDGGWSQRDLAVRVAQFLKVPQPVIEAVIARFRGDEYRNRSALWWNERFVFEKQQHETLASEAPPAPAPGVNLIDGVEPLPAVVSLSDARKKKK